MRFDRLLTHARLATMVPDGLPYGALEDAAIGILGGRIAWVGPMSDVPGKALETDSLDGRWVTPALIDCHTHLVFAGDRSDEYERRLAGESYGDIARSGGGIRKTVEATRLAGAAELAASALSRLDALSAEGVGTIEIKSGYGLNIESELAMLKAARSLGLVSGMRVATTLLAAHTVPVEYEGRSGAYIDEVCIPLIREAAREGLADAVDAYCETIAFSPEEVRRLFIAAKAAGLPVKLHADQLSDTGGALLIAEFGGLSADHLEYSNAQGIAAMAEAATVAVLLPGAYYAIGETRKPPVAELRAAQVAMAVATDANPGSSPLVSILTAANMACALFGLTVEESLAGITREAARALGLGLKYGVWPVSPVANKQLQIYAVGAAAQARQTVETITLGIIQPRTDGPPLKLHTMTKEDLVSFAHELRQAASATDSPDPPLSAGDHCRFCRAANLCPALAQGVRI